MSINFSYAQLLGEKAAFNFDRAERKKQRSDKKLLKKRWAYINQQMVNSLDGDKDKEHFYRGRKKIYGKCFLWMVQEKEMTDEEVLTQLKANLESDLKKDKEQLAQLDKGALTGGENGLVKYMQSANESVNEGRDKDSSSKNPSQKIIAKAPIHNSKDAIPSIIDLRKSYPKEQGEKHGPVAKEFINYEKNVKTLYDKSATKEAKQEALGKIKEVYSKLDKMCSEAHKKYNAFQLFKEGYGKDWEKVASVAKIKTSEEETAVAFSLKRILGDKYIPNGR